MKPIYQIRRYIRMGIVFTIALIAIIIIGLAYLINDVFDYRVSDTLIAAVIAGLSLIYEVHKSKKLNEAEFLIHLNGMFITNKDYKRIYNLLSNYDFENEPDLIEQISNCDISNYLTLFETLYILLKRRVIDIKTLDDLFAYRFFLAVHNPYIQRKKLACSPKNFKNIYRLERLWINYRNSHGGKDHYFLESFHLYNRTDPKLYLSVFGLVDTLKIKFKNRTPKMKKKYAIVIDSKEQHIETIFKLEKEALIETNLNHPGMLRANTKEMLTSCLSSPHVVAHVMDKDELIGFGVLYDPSGNQSESIKKELDTKLFKDVHAIPDHEIMHVKLVVIDSRHRGNNLQFHINRQLEMKAKELNKKLLLTTVSPFNVPSVINTVKSGFTYLNTVKKYDGAIRLIYGKFIK